MKKISLIFLCFLWSNLQAQQLGILDTSFAINGISAIDQSIFESNLALTIQPDGKIVSVGFMEDHGKSKLTALRYLPTGNLDTTFGNKGVFAIAYRPHTNIAQAVTLQPDGKILVAGYTRNAQLPTITNEELLVLRLDINGSIDSTFGTNGVKILNQSYNERPIGIRVIENGKILIAGNKFRENISNFLVYRLNSDGSVDNSFGTNGYKEVFITNNSWNYCYAMELQSDGKILLAGEATVLSEANFGLIRLNSDGSYDLTFSDDGKTTQNISALDDGAQAILLQPDGKIILGGYALTPDNKTETALIRFNPDGSLDPSFGASGMVLTQLGAEYSMIADLNLTASGNIIVAGTLNHYPTFFDLFLSKYTTEGVLDENFGDQGLIFTDYDGHYDGISDAQISSDGRIVVSGAVVSTSNSISEYLLARYWFGEGSDVTDILQVEDIAWAFPNPTSGRKLTLNYTLQKPAIVSFELFSMRGDKVVSLAQFDQAEGKQNETIALPSGLADGAYLVGIRASNKQSFIKIIIQ